MLAYNSNPAVRDAALERLRHHASEARIAPGPLAWNGAKGSLVGCILQSDNLAQWEQTLGLPQWLAVTADGIAATLPSADATLAFGVDLLTAIQPGADVTSAGSAVVVDVLTDVGDFMGKLADVPAEVLRISAEVQALHRRLLNGERPASAEWRAARRAATAQTDTLTSEMLQSLGTCIETAAWDTTTSASVVFDTLRVYSRAVTHKADAESGYTKELDTEIRANLKLMWDNHLAGHPEREQQGITVFSLLEEHNPELAKKIRWKTQLDREAIAYANRRAATALIAQLQRA
ncbi:hypothetical protein LPN04_26330 [Rugamonas sp. A1-17]|nr:hypothetical protein [Rugamonas sp. A1-17]